MLVLVIGEQRYEIDPTKDDWHSIGDNILRGKINMNRLTYLFRQEMEYKEMRVECVDATEAIIYYESELFDPYNILCTLRFNLKSKLMKDLIKRMAEMELGIGKNKCLFTPNQNEFICKINKLCKIPFFASDKPIEEEIHWTLVGELNEWVDSVEIKEGEEKQILTLLTGTISLYYFYGEIPITPQMIADMYELPKYEIREDILTFPKGLLKARDFLDGLVFCYNRMFSQAKSATK